MASHLEKKNDYETTEAAVQPNVGSGEQEDSQNQEGSPIIKWSQEFNCFTINGVLAPIPLTSVPLETGLKDEQQPESSGASSRKRVRGSPSTVVGATEQQQQSAPSLAESSSKRKRRTEGNEELSFRLFKFPKAGEQYLLEIHEPKTGGISRCHLIVYERNKRWKVGVYDLAPGDHVVLPMLEDPTPPIFQKKFEFSLEERLVGWTLEKRKRGNGKEDKFYYHRDRQFRSFVETAAFILYSSKLKDLQLVSTAETSQVLVEAEAAEAMIIISSSEACINLGSSNDGTLKENKHSGAGSAAGTETANPCPEEKKSGSPLLDSISEKTPQNSNEKPEDSNFSSTEPTNDQSNVAQAWQENENSIVGVEAGNETANPCLVEGRIAGPIQENSSEEKEENPNEIVCAPTDEIENEFMDYICDIFEDEAPQSMNEILGEPKHAIS